MNLHVIMKESVWYADTNKIYTRKKRKNEPKSNFTRTELYSSVLKFRSPKDHLLNFIIVFHNKNNNFYEHEKIFMRLSISS